MSESNIEKRYIEKGYTKIFGNKYNSIYLSEIEDSVVLISRGAVVTTTDCNNMSYYESNYMDQDLSIYILTVRQSSVHSWIVMGNMEPYSLPGTTNDIAVFKNGYVISKDPIKDTLLWLSAPLIRGKNIQKVDDHMFTYIENNMIKYINLHGIDDTFKNNSVNSFINDNTHVICTSNNSIEYNDGIFTIYKTDGTKEILDTKTVG